MIPLRRGLMFATSLAVLAGCKAASVAVPDTSVAAIQSQGVPFADARVTGAAPADGAANVRISMRVTEAAPVGFRVLDIPGAWTEAGVSLVSPTVSTAYDATKHARTLAKGLFTDNQNGTFTGRFAFPPMRPAADYEARVYVRNLAGTLQTVQLAASDRRVNVALNAGTNNLSFDVTLNGDVASYQLTSSAINRVDGNSVTQGDVVSLKTGLAKNQPGVSRLDVSLSGACYGNGSTKVLLKRLSTAGAWDTMSWATDTNSEQFVATQFKGGADFAALAGRLDFEAYNDRNELVGTTAMAVQVYGRPDVTLRLR